MVLDMFPEHPGLILSSPCDSGPGHFKALISSL